MSKRPDRRTIMQGTLEKQEKDEQKSGSNDFGEFIPSFNIPKEKWFKLKADEEQQIDVIPFEITTEQYPGYKDLKVYDNDYREYYAMTYYVHNSVGPGGKAKILCAEKNWGKPCPICDERKKILDSKEMTWEEMRDNTDYSSYFWKERAIINVVDRSDNEMYVFDYPTAWFLKNMQKKSKRVRGADSQVCISDLSEDGHYLSMFAEASKRKDNNGNTITYKDGTPVPAEVKDIDFIKRDKGYDESIIDDALKLDTLMNIFSYEDIEKIMHGEEVENSDDSEPEKETPKQEESKPEMSDREKRIQEREERKKAEESKTDDPVCPNGFTFGADNLSDDKCDDCALLSDCEKEYDRLNG